MTHFNQLTPSEAERLAILLEELGETQQIIGKILRHGYESCKPGTNVSNRDLLHLELADVHAITHMMVKVGDISLPQLTEYKESKLNRIKDFMHHIEECDNPDHEYQPEPGCPPCDAWIRRNSKGRNDTDQVSP